MSRGPFEPSYRELPTVLPVFPLAGALLLPGGRLPLNIFEPRYLEMVDDALASDRLIGMIQPCADAEDQGQAPLYAIGCAGRISSFAESGDGRYLITLTGVIRFKISKELDPLSYRRVTPDFRAFAEDLEEASVYVDRPHLLSALKSYFKTQDIEADWNAIEQTEDERLVTAIAMLCPLDTSEKQLLLEADSLTKRAEILIAILEMGSRKGEDGNAFH